MALGVVALVLVLIGALSAVLVHQFRETSGETRAASTKATSDAHFRQMEKRGMAFASFLAEALVNYLYYYDMEVIRGFTASMKMQEGVSYVYIHDHAGKIVHDGTETFESYGLVLDDAYFRRVAASGEPAVWMDGETVHVAAPIHLGTDILGGVRIGLELAGIKADIATERQGLVDIIAAGETNLVLTAAVATLVLAAVGTGLGILFARQISRPIEHLTRITRLIGRGQYDVRVPFRRTDEIGELADALQDMAAARKRAEETLRLAKDEAEAGSRAKSEFLSSMSHELRTPLNAVIGFAQLLEIDDRTPLTDAQKTYVGYIVQSGTHLLEIINDVLELERIEAGKLELAIEDVAPRSVVDDCIVLTEALARSRVVVVVVDRSAGRTLPCVRADFVRFKQVLVNLLSNAVKYNREGGRVFVDCTEGDDSVIRVSVEDTGIGIPEERRSEIFERFSRLSQGTAPVEGTGIGLAVSKQLVDLMGGSIGFESMLGAGSTFWVELPAAKHDSDAEPRVAMPKRARG